MAFRERRAVGLLVAFGVFGAFWGGWAAAVPDIKAALGASDSSFGLALLGIGVGAFPAMLAMGPIFNRYGDRTMPVFLVLFAGAALLPGTASSTSSLFVILVVLGAASGMLDVAINAAVTQWEATRTIRIMNLAHASFSGFFLVSSVSVGFARDGGVGYGTILAWLAAIVACAALFNRPSGSVVRKRGEGPRFRMEPRFLILGGLCGLAFIVEGGLESWSALHLERTLGTNAAVGGLGPGMFAAAMVTGRVLSHFVQAHATERQILVGGGSLAGVGLIVAATALVPAVALAGFAVTGLGTAVAAPTLFGLAGRGASEEQRGSAMSTVTSVAYLGFLLGPPIVGWISGATSLRVGIAFLAVASLSLAALSRRTIEVKDPVR